MNKVSSFTFITAALLPVLLLFFQNCSELISDNSQALQENSANNASLSPLMINSSKSLGFISQNDCKALDENIYFYNKTTHFCFIARNECEAAVLSEKGFNEDLDLACREAINESNFNPSLLIFKTALELGFEKSEDLICSLEYLEMINLKKGVCTKATNGCQISYLSTLGFSKDSLSICN